MTEVEVVKIQLKRQENSQPWGFRLRGGTDQGIPLHVEHVNPKGRAAVAGLTPGDGIAAICGAPTSSMSHPQVKQEMLRAGNDLDLLVAKGVIDASLVPLPAGPNQPQDEKPVAQYKRGGYAVQPNQGSTYQPPPPVRRPGQQPPRPTQVQRPSTDAMGYGAQGGVMQLSGAAMGPPPPQQQPERVQVVEEPTQKIGGPVYKDVQTKTMQVLDQELPAAAEGGAAPSSIFNRNKGERSGYLHAKGPTIQKAYGQRH